MVDKYAVWSLWQALIAESQCRLLRFGSKDMPSVPEVCSPFIKQLSAPTHVHLCLGVLTPHETTASFSSSMDNLEMHFVGLLRWYHKFKQPVAFHIGQLDKHILVLTSLFSLHCSPCPSLLLPGVTLSPKALTHKPLPLV